MNAFWQPGTLIEVAALAACVGLAWAIVRGLQRAFNPELPKS